jgi:hypothetical protein
MDELIEDMARALQLRDFSGDAVKASEVWNDDLHDDAYKDSYRAAARAALAAIHARGDRVVPGVAREVCGRINALLRTKEPTDV